MARYHWDHEVFTTLAEVKAEAQKTVDQFLEDEGLELVYMREHAEYEVEVQVRLRPHR